jgi:hypothetical protein
MPPKAPESKAAKAAKAMAGGKKKAKVRARDGEARSAETLKTNETGRARRGASARTRRRGDRRANGRRWDFNASGTGVALDRARSRATRAARRWRGARAGDRREDGGLTTTTNRVRER